MLEENQEVLAGVRVNRTRKKNTAWDLVMVEEVPMFSGIVSDTLSVGTGFTGEDGTIRLSIKRGLSITGTLELRRK